ncbi:MAG: hypothetical protein MJ113_06165 [Lachnospiraceae bacterium]|nr:hypothetical protein [Lachnospiraceae bacterium]
MANIDTENQTEKNENGFGQKIASVLMIVMIVIVWLLILCLLIKLDVGKFGSQVLYPYLKDVPVLNLILPEMSDEEIAKENNLEYKDIISANKRIKELEETVDKLTIENDDFAERQLNYQQIIEKLKMFEEQQLEFEKRVKEFDREVVYNDRAPSTDEYVKFYEGMYPQNAKEIYEELASSKVYSDYIKQRASYFQKMEAKDAAKILEEMLTGDLESVCLILFCMKPQEVSDRLSAMDPLNAARITKRMLAMDSGLVTK